MTHLPLAEILLISLGLALDAFSVALASGAQGFTKRRVFRLAFHFGLFQFIMPIIGWSIGDILSKYIGAFGQWLVFLMLTSIGIKMLIEGLKKAPESIPDLSKGWKLVSLSIGTSLDALGVGFGFGLLEVSIVGPATLIGIICAAMTILGLYLGVRLYKLLGHRAMLAGGLILIAIGVKMVI
jgi:manganese efflux pump family protein